MFQACKSEAEANLAQRQSIQAHAEAVLTAAETEKREAWQAIDRVTAELDRTRERADRAEYRLSTLAAPSQPANHSQELLKVRPSLLSCHRVPWPLQCMLLATR